MKIYRLSYRALIKISGGDSILFLQNLLSNDITKIKNNIQYNLLLTPQGKITHDMFVFKASSSLYVDCHAHFLEKLENQFQLYKLNLDIQVERCNAQIFICDQEIGIHCYLDPRNHILGYRYYEFADSNQGTNTLGKSIYQTYVKRRLQYIIPEFGIDFMPEQHFPLDLGMEKLHAISFDKGCYIGQEVTARMHYFGKKRKVVKCIDLNCYQVENIEVIQNGKKVGIILNKYDNSALAIIKN